MRLSLLCVGAALTVCPSWAEAQSLFTPLSQQMGITQKLGQRVPTNVPFSDEQGRKVTLGTYLGKSPVLVIPIFYLCKTGCPMITDSLVQTLIKANQPTGMIGYLGKKNGQHPLTPGKDLEIVMLSIDPSEGPRQAADKKNLILNSMDTRTKTGLAKMLSGKDNSLADETDAHLHLLTGAKSNILKVTDALGFQYYINSNTGVIRHPTGSVILTPEGAISSYTIGNDFPTRMLETSLALASRGQISAQKADQSFMFGCIILDPSTGHIRMVVENIVRLGCVVTLLIFGFGIFRMLRNERKAAILNGGGMSGMSRSS